MSNHSSVYPPDPPTIATVAVPVESPLQSGSAPLVVPTINAGVPTVVSAITIQLSSSVTVI